jgi:acetyl-CoA carboxylase biotin carboxyl carrier protein
LNFKEILELIDKVAERGIGSVEIEQAGTKVRIEGKPAAQPAKAESPLPSSISVTNFPPATAPAAPPPKEEVETDLHIITSPIVGTFYRAPNPEADSFVNVGDHISKGKVLCIIEAMKLMNEIESDVEGTLAQIFPQNGQPIEYGEKLFAVKV